MNRFLPFRALALVGAVALTACSSSSPAEDSGQGESDWVSGPSATLPAGILQVPLVRQHVDYSCGDVSALSVLKYWRYDLYSSTVESDLYKPLGTTEKDGTEPQPIAAYISSVGGLTAEFKRDAEESELVAAVDRGEPTIVDIEAWQNVKTAAQLKPWATDWDDGHYVVLVGYDATNFFFMDPSTGNRYAYIPRAEFMDRWHDELGKSNEHVQHMVVFVHADGLTPHTSGKAPPAVATKIN